MQNTPREAHVQSPCRFDSVTTDSEDQASNAKEPGTILLFGIKLAICYSAAQIVRLGGFAA